MAKVKPSRDIMDHPYFGKIKLSYYGAFDSIVTEHLQTTAFYYSLLDISGAEPVGSPGYNPGSTSPSHRESLHREHKVPQEGADAIYLSLSEGYTSSFGGYFSEIYVDNFGVKFVDGEVLVNCDELPVVMKEDKALSIIRRAGRMMKGKTIDDILDGLAERWKERAD